VLLNTKLVPAGLDLIRDWKVCVDEYVQRFDWGL
jgi:hypothetical protein